jgi:hypothetical protein
MTSRAVAATIGSMTMDASAADVPPPSSESHGSGWLVALFIVGVIILGVLTALVISRGDDGTATTTPPQNVTVSRTVTTPPPQVNVQTVTTPPATVTVQPQVTVQTDSGTGSG